MIPAAAPYYNAADPETRGRSRVRTDFKSVPRRTAPATPKGMHLMISRRSARRLVVSCSNACPHRRLRAQALHHRWHAAFRVVTDVWVAHALRYSERAPVGDASDLPHRLSHLPSVLFPRFSTSSRARQHTSNVFSNAYGKSTDSVQIGLATPWPPCPKVAGPFLPQPASEASVAAGWPPRPPLKKRPNVAIDFFENSTNLLA